MCVAALGLIGALASAAGSIVGGMAQQQAANAQAAVYTQQAEAERLTSQYNANRQQEKAVRLIAQQRGGLLANGIALDGSALDLIDDTTKQTELDVAAIRWNGELKARNFETQAAAYEAKGDAAMVGGIIGAIAPTIKGFGGDPAPVSLPSYGTSMADA